MSESKPTTLKPDWMSENDWKELNRPRTLKDASERLRYLVGEIVFHDAPNTPTFVKKEIEYWIDFITAHEAANAKTTKALAEKVAEEGK